jgi:hypothetical protein
MKPVHETDAKIRQRLLRECEGVVAERGQLEALAPQYFRYIDSKKRVKEHWKRIIYIVRLIGPERAAKIVKTDPTGILREIADNPSQSDDGKVRLPLWKAMREYLREEGDSKVGDIRAYLESKDFTNLTRQTIESAIKRHSETFSVRTARHERFVSLKENEEGESASDDN